MLVNFRFKNFKSFYNENNLSLQATKDNELEEINTFNVNETLFNKTEQPELLKSAIIFGSNASGKSNVIKGITYMYNAIRLSSAQQIDVIKNNETFAFYENANNEISLYEVEIIQNNNLYKYGFTILQGKIEKEWLYKRNERTTIVFEREKKKLKLTGNELVQSLINIPETTLFLSIGSNFNLSISNYLKDVLDWFNNIIIVFENNANSLDIYSVEK